MIPSHGISSTIKLFYGIKNETIGIIYFVINLQYRCSIIIIAGIEFTNHRTEWVCSQIWQLLQWPDAFWWNRNRVWSDFHLIHESIDGNQIRTTENGKHGKIKTIALQSSIIWKRWCIKSLDLNSMFLKMFTERKKTVYNTNNNTRAIRSDNDLHHSFIPCDRSWTNTAHDSLSFRRFLYDKNLHSNMRKYWKFLHRFFLFIRIPNKYAYISFDARFQHEFMFLFPSLCHSRFSGPAETD